jgi:ankyrin repeat protein
VKFLIELGADVLATTNSGNMAVHVGCCKGSVEVVEVLLERMEEGSAGVVVVGGGGVKKGKESVVVMADVRGANGWGCLHWSAANGE